MSHWLPRPSDSHLTRSSTVFHTRKTTRGWSGEKEGCWADVLQQSHQAKGCRAESMEPPHSGSHFTSQMALQETNAPPAAFGAWKLNYPQCPQNTSDPSAAGRPSCPCSTEWKFCIFSLRSADSESSHFAEALNSLLKCNLGSILFQLLCSNFNQVLKRKILKNHLKIQSSGTMWKWNGQAITQLEQKTITFTLTLLTHWAPALLNAAARRQREMPFHTQSCAPSSQLPREVLLPSAEISSFEQDRLKKKVLKALYL